MRQARRSGLKAWLAVAVLGVACHAQAQPQPAGPPTQPMLRIDTGGLTALPRALVPDEQGGVFYTGGDDKAVRVWRSADLRLIDTWRLPAAPGPEGQINAMALTPDGRHLAVGGWTGQTWDGAVCIYFFDTRSGQIVKRLSGIGASIGALRFSSDGELLAVGLVDKGGLFVAKWREGRLVFRDTDYPGSVLGIDVAGPRLAAVGMGAGLRVYDMASGRITGNAKLNEGRLPVRVRYSPTGELLAVGFHDATQVGVYRAEGLQPAWAPRLAASAGQANLSAVAWSADGQRLHAGGDPGRETRSKVYTWDLWATGAPRVADIASQRLAAFEPQADGALLFVAEDPVVGRVPLAGAVQLAAASGVRDLRSAERAFAVSHGGSRIDVAHGAAGRETFSFDAGRMQLGVGAVTLTSGTPGASSASRLLVPVQWQPGQPQAKVAGRAVELKPYEAVHALAYLPSGDPVLATEYGVRAYMSNGSLRWNADVGAVARAVRASGDGRFVLVAAGDGTVHWLHAADGRSALTLFVHANSHEWVAWTPEGYYASSPQGDELIGWQINRSKLERADFYRASQFERLLYRPDIVRLALQDISPARAMPRQPGGDFNIARLAEIAPPRIELLDLQPVGDARSAGQMRLRFKATRNGPHLRDWKVFIDDIPITRSAERGLSGAEEQSFARELTFTALSKAGTLRIEVGTEAAIGVKELALPLTVQPGVPMAGDLYLLAIGVRQFPQLPSRLELMYTERDAQEVSAFFSRQQGRQYRRVHTRLLSDGSVLKPTPATITDSLAFLKQAGPDDTVILFLASHGVRDARGNYYFATAQSRTDDLCSILQDERGSRPAFCEGVAGTGDRSSFVEWKVFFDALGASAGRRVLVVDTCEAGNIGGLADVGSLRKRSASSRFSLLLASDDGEASQEYAAGRHGLFTYAWLRALEAGAAGGASTLGASFEAARAEVHRLHDRRAGPMTPRLDTPALWRELPLARSRP